MSSRKSCYTKKKRKLNRSISLSIFYYHPSVCNCLKKRVFILKIETFFHGKWGPSANRSGLIFTQKNQQTIHNQKNKKERCFCSISTRTTKQNSNCLMCVSKNVHIVAKCFLKLHFLLLLSLITLYITIIVCRNKRI